MKIDEAAFGLAFADLSDVSRYSARRIVETYLAALPALPSAEPGRDRIAVVVDANGYGLADIVSPKVRVVREESWVALEHDARESHECAGPFARAIIRCNLPRPAEPVEVEGSVEGVG